MKTRVILIRHEAPAPKEEKPLPNCLTNGGRQRAFHSGEVLTELGYKIDVAWSSPQFRAIETLQGNLAGNSGGKGPIPLNGVDVRFGDMLLGAFPFTEGEKQKLISEAKEAGLGPEEALLKLPQYAEKGARRGEEGGRALLEIVRANMGKTIAIVSHGGSRIEVVIRYLCGDEEVPMVDPGGVVVIVFDETLMAHSFVALGNLGKK